MLSLIVVGIGQSMGLLTCNVIIQQRFHKSRSLATGVSIMGWSVGNFFGAPLTELLLNMYGLHGTLAMLGAIQAHRIPLALQFRSPKRFVASKSSTEVDSCYLLYEFSVFCNVEILSGGAFLPNQCPVLPQCCIQWSIISAVWCNKIQRCLVLIFVWHPLDYY